MELSTYPLTSASSKWGELASEMSALGLGEIPTVEGVFAEQINTWIAGAVQNLAGFSTAATELSTAAGESSDEESKLAAAPTLSDIAILGKEIKDDSDAGRDFTEKAKRLKEMKAEHDAAKEELETSSTETQSQTECASIPQFEGLGIPGEPQYIPPEKDSGGGNDPTDPPGSKPEPGDKPGGTPSDPSKDRKLPDISPKPETPSVTTPSDAAHTQLSSDSPAPKTTPSTTPSASPTVAQPSSSAAQQPQMPQVSMGQTPTTGGQPQGQQSPQTPRGNTIDDLKKRMQEAERKSDKDEDKKADDAATGDAPGNDVGGAALVTGATAAGVPGAPTAPTVPGAPTTPGAPPPPGGVGGGPVGGAGAMGSGNNAQAKNANIVAAAQPEPPLPTAPRVEGSQQSPNFDWNSDAVLPPSDGKKDTP